MTITAVAKTKIYIGGISYPTDQAIAPVLADYSAETWVAINGTTSIGDVGDEAEVIKVNVIADARTYKLKGQRDAGSFSLDCAFDDTDPGQLALVAALAVDGNFSFKVVANNPGATAKGSTTYFRGMVTTCQTKFGAANSPITLTSKIEVNSAPLAVAAS